MIRIDRKSITNEIEYYKKELAIVEDLIKTLSSDYDVQVQRRSYMQVQRRSYYLRNIRYLERILFYYDKYLNDLD